MYAKVPAELREPLLKEIKRTRRSSFVKIFPLLVIIFAAISAFIIFIKGHALIDIVRELFGTEISDMAFWGIFGAVVIFLTASVLIYFLRQDYAECKLQDYLHCPNCNVVDNYDTGHCPKCASLVTEKACFIYTSYKEEKEVIKRWGLQIYQEAKSPS